MLKPVSLRIFLALFSLAVVLLGCESKPKELSLISGFTMGTSWSVKYLPAAETNDPQTLKAEVDRLLEAINAQMSTYQADSALSQFNTAEAGDIVVLPEDTITVLKAALALSADTEGLYDVTIGPLVNLWGFGPNPNRDSLPEPYLIDEVLTRVGWQQLVLADQGLLQPGGVYVDLSSIAKGFAVDKIAAFLATQGVENYLVEVGGELRAAGTKPYQQPWRVAVEKPIPGVREIDSVIRLTDVAVATSGDYRNFFEYKGVQYSHTLDPRTGYPVKHNLASVTVLHASAMRADGLATALLALGPERGMAFAEEKGLAVYFLVREGSGFAALSTPAFEALMEEM